MPDRAPADLFDASGALVASAPTRLDFGGGWTDVPPYCDEEGGRVCNVAIARRATVRLTARGALALGAIAAPGRRDDAAPLVSAALRRAALDGSVRAELASDFPIAAGLGGSSAAGVALAAAVAAWRGELRPDEDLGAAQRDQLAEWSRAVEVEEAGIAGGRQDHYAAAHGGALCLDFGAWAGGRAARAHPIPLRDTTVAALERRAFVVYTGESRVSGDTITAVLDAYRARDPRVVEALARMAVLAGEMADALERGDLDALGAQLSEHWTYQRALHPAIPTPRIDAIVDRATAAGALGAKALGASGGGCVLVLAPEDGVAQVRAAIASLGEPVPFAVDRTGVTVVRESR